MVIARSVFINSRDGRGLCDVQCCGLCEEADPGRDMEQCVVSVVSIRSHQLHQELGVRLVRGGRFVGRSIRVDDGAGQGIEGQPPR